MSTFDLERIAQRAADIVESRRKNRVIVGDNDVKLLETLLEFCRGKGVDVGYTAALERAIALVRSST